MILYELIKWSVITPTSSEQQPQDVTDSRKMVSDLYWSQLLRCRCLTIPWIQWDAFMTRSPTYQHWSHSLGKDSPFWGIQGFVPGWWPVFLPGCVASSPWPVCFRFRNSRDASQRGGTPGWAWMESETGSVAGSESQAEGRQKSSNSTLHLHSESSRLHA